uniref:Gag-Pol polyprotein n=1 Tax=Zeugodacus cucurbitae TaxID=28588 RepID=A0A0A1XCF4_ZEUCU
MIGSLLLQTDLKVIPLPRLSSYCSIFTAETKAELFASNSGNKTIICSDSKSAIDAIFNQLNDCPMITKIRNLINKCNKRIIIIMWVPGHVGIKGNEWPTYVQKQQAKNHYTRRAYFTTKDIKQYVKQHTYCFQNDWISYNHHDKLANPLGKTPHYSNNNTCKNIKTFVRIKIGHKLATRGHLLNGTNKPKCPLCGSGDFTINHILDRCSPLQQPRVLIFGNTKPSDLLNCTDDNNVNLFEKL